MSIPYDKGKLIPGLSYLEYAAVPGLRASDLKLLKRSPAHWQAAKNAPKKKTDALAFGTLFHTAIEHPERFLELYAVEPDVDLRTKIGKQELEEFKDKCKDDAIIVPYDWADDLVGMLRSCMNHKLLKNLLKDGVRETSLFVDDTETGELLQCRPDFISAKGFLVDIKTTRDASQSFFLNEIFSSRFSGSPFYGLQAAHYAHCARMSQVCNGDSFIFVAIEKEPPYGIMIYPMDEGCLGPGEQWRSDLTKLYAECRKTQQWPCYPERAVQVFPPEWVELPPMEGA